MAENTNAKKHADSKGCKYERNKIPDAKIAALANANPHKTEHNITAVQDKELIQFDICFFIF
jgi:hypothetical protein